tara:strand:- start:708 stop:1139 length:432 start_codon:yes stop_codon:yes gene_type:complete
MTQSKDIAKQVALKAAIELTKDKFNVDDNITEQLEVIKQISNNLYEHIKPVVPFQDPPSVVEIEPANEQKVTYKYGNDTNTSEDTASEAQKKFVKDLFAKLPKDEKQKYDKYVNGTTMTWQFAKKHIDLFQEIINKEKDVAPF